MKASCFIECKLLIWSHCSSYNMPLNSFLSGKPRSEEQEHLCNGRRPPQPPTHLMRVITRVSWQMALPASPAPPTPDSLLPVIFPFLLFLSLSFAAFLSGVSRLPRKQSHNYQCTTVTRSNHITVCFFLLFWFLFQQNIIRVKQEQKYIFAVQQEYLISG